VENLQNNGVFRLKLLGSIERQTTATREQTKTLTDFAEALFEKLDALIVPQEAIDEVEEEQQKIKITEPQIDEDEDDFALPPLNLKKK
jgi:hypothetical protein